MAAGAHLGNYAVIATADGYLGFQAPGNNVLGP
jgi:hypothetical protein